MYLINKNIKRKLFCAQKNKELYFKNYHIHECKLKKKKKKRKGKVEMIP